MNPDTPACGKRDCPARATQVDASGVGYCDQHAEPDCVPVAERPFDAWWAAASLADERGDRRWEGLEYGEWPDGGGAA